MTVVPTRLPEVLLLELPIYRDDRGHFLEVWHQVKSSAAGLPERFVQDNVSYSKGSVVRGLHYQHPRPQGKLVTVLHGAIYDVAVDIRLGSPTFGQWVGLELSSENGRQMYVPEGFAHGFAVTSESALVLYKCTEYYQPGAEGAVLWNDPELGITWPVREDGVIVSAKDRTAARLSAIEEARLPRHHGLGSPS